jgi:hydrogenase nickel incorporation protein HypB
MLENKEAKIREADIQATEIEVMEDVYDRNEKAAQELNEKLNKNKVFALNVMGSPGVGKTSVLSSIIPLLDKKAWVIEGDIQSSIDSERLNKLGIETYQINTGGACHLDSPAIARANDELKPKDGYLFIENIGNLVCPAEFMIGEHVKLLISNVTEGSDKPYKYPLAFEKADIILVNKIDLMEHVDFDREMFLKGVRALNKTVPVIFVSAKKGEGFEEVAAWIKEKAKSIVGE